MKPKFVKYEIDVCERYKIGGSYRFTMTCSTKKESKEYIKNYKRGMDVSEMWFRLKKKTEEVLLETVS